MSNLSRENVLFSRFFFLKKKNYLEENKFDGFEADKKKKNKKGNLGYIR
jgi:hypothetical protein